MSGKISEDSKESRVRDFVGKVVQIWKETHDVKSLRIELDERMDFTPGQHCMVSFLDEEGEKSVERPFTPCNPNLPDDMIELTVKKVGSFTSSLHSLEVGERLNIRGPLGDTLVWKRNSEDIVYLTGGSGITPFMAHIRHVLAEDLDNRLTLFFGNMKEEDIIYRGELEEINRHENIKVVNTIAEDIPEDWNGETGFIDRAMIERHLDDLDDKIWYVCGPPPMMDAMRELLSDIGIPKERWRIDSWELPGKNM